MSNRRTTWWGDALRGAIAGGVAVWVMDLVTTGLQASQTKASMEAEKSASPNGQSSLDNLVDRLTEPLGLDLDEDVHARAVQALHYGLGILPGALYSVTRRRLPLIGAGRGLAYGTALWAFNDEWLNATLGLSGAFEAYPLETHARGAVGHLVLGLVTDGGVDILGG